MLGDKKLLIASFYSPWFPVSLAYVASTLERANIPYDYCDVNKGFDFLDSGLREGRYWGVCSGGTMSKFSKIQELFRHIKFRDPMVITFLGGRMAMDLGSELLFKSLDLDFCLKGESESNLVDFISSLGGKGSSIPGLVIRGDDSRKELPPRPLESLTGIRPSYSFTNMDELLLGITGNIPIMTGRGCEGNCSFCVKYPHRFVERSFEDIFWDVDQVLRLGCRQVCFLSSVIFHKEETLFRFVEEYKLRFKTPFVCNLRGNTSLEALRALYEAGCRGLHIGLESFQDDKLRLMRKGSTGRQNSELVREAIRLKIPYIECGMIYGYLDETREMIEEDLRVDRSLAVQSRFYPLVPYPGTEVYLEGRRRGLLPIEEEILPQIPLMEGQGAMFVQLYSETPSGKRIQPNLSKVPDREFYPMLHKAYLSFLRRFKLRSPRLLKKGLETTLSGTCPFCGETISSSLGEDAIGTYGYWKLRPICINSKGLCRMVNCYFTATLYDIPSIDEDRQKVLEEIHRREVVLVGDKFNLELSLELDLFELTSFKLIGTYSRDVNSDFLLENSFSRVPSTRCLTDREIASSSALLLTVDRGGHYLKHLLSLGIPSTRVIHGVPDIGGSL